MSSRHAGTQPVPPRRRRDSSCDTVDWLRSSLRSNSETHFSPGDNAQRICKRVLFAIALRNSIALSVMCSELAACAPEGRFPARYFATAATGSRSNVVTMSTLRADIRPIAPGPARLTITAKTVSSGCGPAPENSRMESFFGKIQPLHLVRLGASIRLEHEKAAARFGVAVHRSRILTRDRDANDLPPTLVRSVKQCSYHIIAMCELVFFLLITRPPEYYSFMILE